MNHRTTQRRTPVRRPRLTPTIRPLRRALLIITAAAVLFAPVLNTDAQRADPDQPLSEIMRGKLKQSQAVLEGLALERFPQIERGAMELIDLTHRAEWSVVDEPDYQRYSEDFRRHLQALAGAARRANLDGATLAYVQMTMSCVDCHKYIRTAGIHRRL